MSMKNDVTVVVEDRLVIVDGEAVEFEGGVELAEGHEGLWALQWHGGKGELEFSDRTGRALEPKDYRLEVKPYVDQHATRLKAIQDEEARLAAEAEAERNRPENVRARRIEEITTRLGAVDSASTRALRALAAGTASDADRDRLASLEEQARTLRAELKALEEA